MSMKWITANARLKDGITILNNLSTKTFQKLSQRIVTSENVTFNDEEVSQLKQTLDVSDETLNLLIQTIIYIFKQSNKVILKPTLLQKHLIDNLSITPGKAEEFVRIWSEYLKSEVGNFDNRVKLENIAWELNLQTADNIGDKQSVPMARLKLGFGESRDYKENVVVEMNEDELSQLYQTLETVQLKLDNINNA